MSTNFFNDAPASYPARTQRDGQRRARINVTAISAAPRAMRDQLLDPNRVIGENLHSLTIHSPEQRSIFERLCEAADLPCFRFQSQGVSAVVIEVKSPQEMDRYDAIIEKLHRHCQELFKSVVRIHDEIARSERAARRKVRARQEDEATFRRIRPKGRQIK